MIQYDTYDCGWPLRPRGGGQTLNGQKTLVFLHVPLGSVGGKDYDEHTIEPFWNISIKNSY